MTNPIDALIRLIKKMANDPNHLKRGIHRVGIVIGSILFLPAALYFLFSLEQIIEMLLGKAKQSGDDLVMMVGIMFGSLFAVSVPVILAKALGWIVAGFQKRNE